MDDCVVQVTQWQKSEHLLDGWINFLTLKNYKLRVRKKINREGRTMYSIFRNLNKEEQKEIADKKYILVKNSLERREVNGRRVK